MNMSKFELRDDFSGVDFSQYKTKVIFDEELLNSFSIVSLDSLLKARLNEEDIERMQQLRGRKIEEERRLREMEQRGEWQ